MKTGARVGRRAALRRALRWALNAAALATPMHLAAQATPQTHALLVAVGRVAELPPRLWLRGPDNDLQLMRQALLERGVPATHITSLGAAPGATAAATGAAIGQAMQTLLLRAQPGDQVVLHLAGHGVQVPPRPGAPAEPDGLDEVFLTIDTQRWDAQRGLLPQALYDHDIGAWMDALAARQVRVLAVLDTCHAAGMHRGTTATSAYTRQRGIAAEELGVPARQTTGAGAAPPAASATRAPPSAPGRTLALAARAHESTPESWLPKGAPQARLHGVFTYAVVQALREGARDAAALRDSIARQYASAGRASPVPMVLGAGSNALP